MRGASVFSTRALDFHSYTYAKYGGEILKQPGMFAWQVFDQKAVHLLRDEYRIPRTTKEKADTLEALAERLEGVDPKGFLDTVRAFNAAPRPDVPFNPNIHDGLRTAGLAIDKSNWAQRLDTPPYEAYAVTTGITFTFGGLKITNDAEVEDVTGRAIPGLFAAGEIVGGLYYHNYASGTGLMAGSVFGRIAGQQRGGLRETVAGDAPSTASRLRLKRESRDPATRCASSASPMPRAAAPDALPQPKGSLTCEQSCHVLLSVQS